ncbi:carnitine O-palmitoyltransferase 2, mitochondrial-like [Brevipalpus obovatus]|uniref:carnitine O-palmitoyltransferase 2, mitochondrial-like n=1 Tax=Brevipalpus obovatus TaxID=246614 RepID=UPI003D9E1EE2
MRYCPTNWNQLIRHSWPLGRHSLKTWSVGADDYNYLDKSQIPTDYYQSKLPILPIPSLEDSCRRYLAALRPIIANDEQYQKTVDIVGSFSIGIGQQLHNKLLEQNGKQMKHTSYIADDWTDSYLSSRVPLPLNFNPFLILQDDPDYRFNSPCVKASNYIISCLRYRRSLLDNVLAPEVDRGKGGDSNVTPYDMSQHYNLFETTRIPFVDIDVLQNFQSSKHIVVMKNGNFYTFDVLDEQNNILPASRISSCIEHIWNLPNTESDPNSISWLTTIPRDEWAHIRDHIIAEPLNSSNLSLIDSALTVICLEPDVESPDSSNPIPYLSKNFLHGCPSPDDNNVCLNRWFDKSFSTIFTADGTAAINFEHSWCDGITLTRFYERVFSDFTKNHFVSPDDLNKNGKSCDSIRRLDFSLDDTIKLSIEEAKKKHLSITRNLDVSHISRDGLTKSFLKSKKVSPDSFFQLAFQMAYYKISQGKTPVTYESCSTSHFKHGRTENIRAATLQTQKACQLFHSDEQASSTGRLRSAINACSQYHSKIAKEATMGQGFDRHFFALKMCALRQGMEDVSLFKDCSHRYALNFVLSTSSLYAKKLVAGGYGPVVDDGFGLAYGYNQDNLSALITNYKSHTNGSEFEDALRTSFDELCRVLRES